MQAVIGDDALDGAQTNGEVGLPQFLGDDVGGGVGVQEEVTQDLAHGLIGAAVVGLGAGFVGLEGSDAALEEGVQQLIVAGTGKAVSVRDSGDVLLEALAFHEHEETTRESVVWVYGQGAGRAGELVGGGIERQHRVHAGKVRRSGGYV